jgi:uncharacterized protein YdaU (DUF1376 family)
LLEHGVYRQLLDTYYLNEKPIPDDIPEVSRRLSAKTDLDILAIQSVLKDFFVLTENGWIHPRCDQEIAWYHGKADRARKNGKLGGRPKKTKVVIFENPDVTQTKPDHKLTNNQEPITNNHKPIKKTPKPPTASPGGFADFWKAYPKKVAKPAALKAFVKLHINGELPLLLEAIENQGLRSRDLQFVPNPSTWLNQRRWEDEIAVARGIDFDRVAELAGFGESDE